MLISHTKALRGNNFKSILNGTTVINQKSSYILKSNLPIGVQNITLKSINDEKYKNIYNPFRVSDYINPSQYGIKMISTVYDEDSFVTCLSNEKIRVIKRKFSLNPVFEPVIA